MTSNDTECIVIFAGEENFKEFMKIFNFIALSKYTIYADIGITLP